MDALDELKESTEPRDHDGLAARLAILTSRDSTQPYRQKVTMRSNPPDN
jgi:hypothetical protein